MGVAFGVAWLEGLPASCGVGARLRGCATVSRPPPRFFAGGHAFVVRRGFPAFRVFWFFCGGGNCLFLPLPSPGWCTHWSAFVGANRVTVGAWIGCGPCPGPMGRLGYVHAGPGGLSCRVRFGSAAWAVAPAGFVRSWVKGGCDYLCPPAFALPVLTFMWRSVRAGRRSRVWGGGSVGLTVAPSLCVSVPCFGAVVCFGAPCCVLLCFALLCRAGLSCVAVRSALSCRAAPCRAVVCLAVASLAAPCCAKRRCVLLCCVVPKALLPKEKGRDVYPRVKVNGLGCVCCVRAVCKCVVA